MGTLAEFRKANPDYADVPDDVLADALYRKFYEGKVDRAAFDKAIGGEPVVTVEVGGKEVARSYKHNLPAVSDKADRDGVDDPNTLPEMDRKEFDAERATPVDPDAEPLTVGDIKKKFRPGGAKGAFGRGLGRSVAPTVGGMGGFMAGAAGGAALASPLALTGVGALAVPAAALIGGLGGAFGGAIGADKLQDFAIPEDTKRKLGWDPESVKADREQYPVASFAGEVLPGALTGRPTKRVLDTVLSGGLSGGLEAGMEAYRGEDLDWRKIALAGGAGVASAGKWMPDEGPLNKVIRETTPRKKDGFARRDAEQKIDETRKGLKSIGVTATPLDVVPGRTAERAVRRSSEASFNAGDIYERYADVVEGTGPMSTVAGAQRAADQLPGTGVQTPTERRAAAQGSVQAAEASLRPGVVRGQGSEAVARRLSSEHQSARQKADQLFEEARGAGDAAIMRIDGADDNPWQPLQDEQVKSLGLQGEAYMMPSSGEIRVVGEPQTAGGKTYGSLGPRNKAEINAHLRESVADFDNLAGSIPGTLSVLNKIEQLETPTMGQLYAFREALNKVRQNGEGKDPIAAGRVIDAIDELASTLSDAGRLTGDPALVQKWNTAIGGWRDYKRAFQSGDITEKLTTMRRDANGNLVENVDPEAARKTIFGAANDTNAALQNLKTLRERLGPDSDDWEKLRQDAYEHWFGAVPGEPGTDVARLQKRIEENPAMADLLLTRADRQRLETAVGRVRGAEATEQALSIADSFLTASRRDFDNMVKTAEARPETRNDMRVGIRDSIREKFKTAQGAAAWLADFKGNPDAQYNLERALGPAEAQKLTRQAEALVRRHRRATSPGSAQAEENHGGARVADAVRSGVNIGGGHVAFGIAPAMRYLTGLGMDPKRAEQLAQEITDPARTDAAIAQIKKIYGSSAAENMLRTMGRTVQNTPTYPGSVVTRGVVTAQDRKEAPVSVEVEIDMSPEAMERRWRADEANDFMGDAAKRWGNGDEVQSDAPSTVGGAATSPVGAIRSYIDAAGLQEGTGKNPESSAVGAYQFIDGTFAAYAKRNFPEYTKGLTNRAIAARLRSKPGKPTLIDGRPIEQLFMEQFTEDNARTIAKAGMEVTPANLYLAHFAGPQGFLDVAKAAPDTPITKVLDPAAIYANRGIRFRGKKFRQLTAGELREWTADRMNHQMAKAAPKPVG